MTDFDEPGSFDERSPEVAVKRLRLARELLGPNGALSKKLPGYEPREGQLEVADAVSRLLAGDGALLCEAGTGIGKTFAYLVPALLSGRKVVISTATKALQDQIAERDLPRLLDALGMRVDYAVMKGLSNYLCRRRYKEFLLSEEAVRPMYAQKLSLLRSWLKETESGELGELVTFEEQSKLRLEVASSSETRLGAQCPEFDRCFVTEMRREADSAQIIIVNHHLFFADLALRGPHPGRVLPDYDAVLFDEAHQIEDTAALFFGVRVTEAQLARLEKDAARILGRAAPLGGPLDPRAGLSVIFSFGKAVAEFFKKIAEGLGTTRGALPTNFFEGERKEAYRTLEQATEDLAAVLEARAALVSDDTELRDLLEHTGRRARSTLEELTLITSPTTGSVTWLEMTPQGAVLNSTPVDLSQLLRQRLFEAVPAVGLLSATLSTGSGKDKAGFGFVRSRLGLSGSSRVEELSVPSPFDYENQCLLYLPKDLPPVSDPEFLGAAADRAEELVRLTDGGAFLLTTSLAAMRRLHELLRPRLADFPLYLQGERPKDALLNAFRASGRAVLIATASFWEGVDVPGAALRLVVLEKLPFAVPTDPVFQARSAALEARGQSAFAHLALPGAAISLKQGFGRLIRRGDDHGIVALFDERIHSRAYGKRLLAALPNARRTAELKEVRQLAAHYARRP